jgi:hypothetical protein
VINKGKSEADQHIRVSFENSETFRDTNVDDIINHPAIFLQDTSGIGMDVRLYGRSSSHVKEKISSAETGRGGQQMDGA